jgi:hypothetical protein
MSEKTIYHNLKKHIEEVNLWRVENRLDNGMPDYHFAASSGRNGWIEAKYILTIDRKVKFRPAQPQWLMNYCNTGNCALIIVKVGNIGHVIFEGSKAEELKTKRVWEVDGIFLLGKHKQYWGLVEEEILRLYEKIKSPASRAKLPE